MSLRSAIRLAFIFWAGCLAPYWATAQGTRLNNLVTELVAHDSVNVSGTREIAFTNPRKGWVYIAVTASNPNDPTVEMLLDGGVRIGSTSGSQTAEAMRELPEGSHTLTLKSSGKPSDVRVAIRAMPETHFVRYPQEPAYPELGTFSWEWLNEHVLDSVNTLVGIPGEPLDAVIDEWTGSGRKLLSYGHLPHTEGITGEGVFEYWNRNPGFQDPRLGGIIADEFQGRQHPLYPVWIDGMHRLGELYKDSGKAFYAYCGGPSMYSRPEAVKLVQTVFGADFRMAWERYHHEMPTLPEARELMDDLLGEELEKWQAVFPDCQKQMVLVLGIFATGPDLDVHPQVNYKVWMDMQMQYLATHPRFDGLFGVHWWYSGAASEEILRWESALYRHYCIEGKTELLSDQLGWTYMNQQIANADFHSKFKGWAVQPASEGSMKPGYLERYARIQNRYWQRTAYPDDPSGNTYAWMKRQANAPNAVSQTIRNLTPGALYTVQLITADYQDIVNGVSAEKPHAISFLVTGAKVVPERSFLNISTKSPWSHSQLPFENGPAIFNHHRVMFRATAPTAKLTITDWASDENPGGPIGQELMFNYVQVQPYFEVTH